MKYKKKVKGRKRHIVPDTMGNLLAIWVYAANTHDTKSGINPAKKAFEKLLLKIAIGHDIMNYPSGFAQRKARALKRLSVIKRG
ncbi:MAG: hypothetical protein FWG63_04370 [Defluviitaleaceae bacterium]|nr:hypothetical protein [Defluviitaleaceae bacterium]